MTTPRINALVPLLQVRDLRETIAFYTTHLGFEVQSTFPENAPVWCMMRAGGAQVMFSVHDAASEPRLDGVLYFYPDSVTELWERLREACDIVEPMQVMDYGQREFTIRDPNGFLLSFGEHSDDPAEHTHPHPHDDTAIGHSHTE